MIFNLATRSDGTTGALHSVVLRDARRLAGQVHAAELAHGLQELGFQVERDGIGMFEVVGVDESLTKYFSARREEIETALAEHGVTSKEASGLAAAITKATRGGKREELSRNREAVWKEAAQSLGVNVDDYVENLKANARPLARAAGEKLLAERLAVLPAELTETESVIDRRALLRAIGVALVGTGFGPEHATAEIVELENAC